MYGLSVLKTQTVSLIAIISAILCLALKLRK